MKPCPFCGGTDGEPVEVAIDHNCENWNWAWRCNGCGALGPECGTRQRTEQAWDERVNEDR
jgi:hypothetical protein